MAQQELPDPHQEQIDDYVQDVVSLQAEREQLRNALADMLKLHNHMAPYFSGMALPDYELLNEAPIRAMALLPERLRKEIC